MERKVIVIAGPTCSGKTYLSSLISELLDVEIISADSRQIYKTLDIGTAKPSGAVLRKIPHHFIDKLNPDEDYNISKFEKEGLQKIEEIFLRKKVPVAVGGSGLYIRALVDGIFDEIDTDEEYREYLQKLRAEQGNEYLYELLQKADPEGADNMLPSNWKRIMRALEVIHLSGKPIWQHQREYKRNTSFDFLQFGLEWERSKLYEMIEKRVDEMISNGLIKEVGMILQKGYAAELNSLNTVGYKEIISFLKNELTLERAVELIKRNTRRYAKRQLTWFRKDERIEWIKVKSKGDLKNAADKILNKFRST